MATFTSKRTLHLKPESIWDYLVGANDRTHSKTPAIIDADDPEALYISTADVVKHAESLATSLAIAGVQPEDRVLLVYPTSIFSIPFFLASCKVGSTFVPISAETTPSELQVMIQHVEPKAVVFHPSNLNLREYLDTSNELPLPSMLCLDPLGQVPHLYDLTATEGLAVRCDSGSHTSFLGALSDPDRPCVILHTSGTSGRPKGWIYSGKTFHVALESRVIEMERQFLTDEPTDTQPKVLCGQMAHHLTGFVVPLICLRIAIPVYLTRDYAPKSLLAIVKACGITDLRTRGSTVIDMRHLTDKTSLESLRLLRRIRTSGSPLPLNVNREVVNLARPAKLRIDNCWGCTEIGWLATWDPNQSVDSSAVGELSVGNIAKVVSTEDGRILPHSTPGEIYIKPPVSPVGYYENPAATQESLSSDGWFKTGDFGFIREDGKVFLLDRLKDLIKVRGTHVSSSELEAIIMINSSVKDVAVIGVGVDGDEGPRAYVVPKEGAKLAPEDVISFVATRMPAQKRLSGGVKLVSKLPRTESGKTVRRKLREWAIEELGPVAGSYHAGSSSLGNGPSRDYSSAIEHLNTLPSNAASIQQSLKLRDTVAKPIQNARSWFDKLGLEVSVLDSLRAIHLAGTKGKGSTAVMLESVLLEFNERSEGKSLRVGVYTSPHVQFIRERIRIDGASITESDFAKAFFRLWDQVQSIPGAERPFLPFFLFMTILAFQVFLDKGVNCAIMETGIGGLTDSTNIIPHPRVTAITRLDFDHVDLMGPTIKDIARHKGGIFKPSAVALTVQQEPEGISQLRVSAEAANVDLQISFPLGKQYRTLMGIAGDHQLENAGLAIDIAEAWLHQGRGGTVAQNGELPAFIVAGLRRAKWPGRSDLQIVGNVSWFVDGAHTGESIKHATRWFADALAKASYTKTALVFNRTESNKHELLRTLYDSLGSLLQGKAGPLFDMVVFCTNALTPQLQATPDLMSLNPVPEPDTSEQEALARTWSLLDSNASEVRVVRSVTEAIEIVSALGMKTQEDLETPDKQRTACLVTGSLKLVGPCLTVLRGGAQV